jgi:hypothetical protein
LNVMSRCLFDWEGFMNENRSAVALFILAGLAGCGTTGRIDIYTCDDPCGNGQPGWTCDDACKPCKGECVTLPPLGFDGPALLWIGHDPIPPACPERAPTSVFEGYADLDNSYECPACACAAPSCELPPGLQTSTSIMCQGPDFAPFEAEAPWSGACASPTTVSSSELASILIPPPTVSGCAPMVDSLPRPRSVTSPWSTFARACQGEAVPNACGDPGKTCMAMPEPPPPGFSQCILYLRDGEPECPDDYPDKHALYGDLEDTRSCTPCECGPPRESTCTALVSAYEDRGCTTLLGSEAVTLDRSKCVGGPGLRLGSVEAEWVENVPGTCAPSGGEVTGEITPTRPSIFCCQQPRYDDLR